MSTVTEFSHKKKEAAFGFGRLKFSAFTLQTWIYIEIGLISWLELALFLLLHYSLRGNCEYISRSRICVNICGTDHMVRNPRPLLHTASDQKMEVGKA